MIIAVRRFVTSFTEWASQRDDILAVLLVGSQARGTATPSSDVDLVIVAVRPEEYLRDHGWTNTFGQPTRNAVEAYGKLMSIRAWYDSGLQVEFGFGDATWPFDPGSQAVMADGKKVLLDRNRFFQA
jgi:predicted nucleotidyltransferase